MDNFDDIADLMIPHDVLVVGDKRFKLLGLGLPEVMYVVRNHFDALDPLYQMAKVGKLGADVTEIAGQLNEHFGPIATSIIACGMRTKAVDKVAALNMAQQIEALDKIIRLTLINSGGVEKTMEIIIRALNAMAAQKPRRP